MAHITKDIGEEITSNIKKIKQIQKSELNNKNNTETAKKSNNNFQSNKYFIVKP